MGWVDESDLDWGFGAGQQSVLEPRVGGVGLFPPRHGHRRVSRICVFTHASLLRPSVTPHPGVTVGNFFLNFFFPFLTPKMKMKMKKVAMSARTRPRRSTFGSK